MRSREITSGLCVAAALVLVGATEYGRAQQPPATPAAAGQPAGRGAAPAPRPPLLDKDHLRFQPEDAANGGPVFGGREGEPGVYITRNLFRAGAGSRPHYHDQDRWVTVIKGTWYTAVGDVYEPDKMIAIKPGGMMYHPAGLHHYDGAKEEDVIVQIMGIGPVKTVQTEVDANGQPVQRGGGAGRGATPPAAPQR